MATIAIGDVHGNLKALSHLLLKIMPELTENNTVVFIGDTIDGFPESSRCIDRILQFKKESPCATISIKGNHEEWFLETMKDPTKHSWILSMEGLSTIASYSVEANRILRQEMKRIGPSLIIDHLPLPYEVFFKKVPESHKEFFKQMVDYYRDGSFVFVHGGVSEAYTSVETEAVRPMRWGRKGFPEYYIGADTIIYGHWSDKATMTNDWPTPYQTKNSICLDTIKHGVLTAVRVPDKNIIQSGRYMY